MGKTIQTKELKKKKIRTKPKAYLENNLLAFLFFYTHKKTCASNLTSKNLKLSEIIYSHGVHLH